MTDRYVLEALQRKIIDAHASSGSGLPLKCVGVSIDIPTDNKWFEVVYIPNNIDNELWSDGFTYRGVIRLIVHWPADGSGAYAAMDELQSVADYILKGDKFADPSNNATVRVTEKPSMSAPMEEPPELLVALTIQYECFKI